MYIQVLLNYHGRMTEYRHSESEPIPCMGKSILFEGKLVKVVARVDLPTSTPELTCVLLDVEDDPRPQRVNTGATETPH